MVVVTQRLAVAAKNAVVVSVVVVTANIVVVAIRLGAFVVTPVI